MELNLQEFMAQVKLPNGYKFYTIYDGVGYKLVLGKDLEQSKNLSISSNEFERKNKETMDEAIDKLYQFRYSIQKKNVHTFLAKISKYDRYQLLDILDYIYDNSEELDYEEDYGEYSKETLLNIIRFEIEHSYYEWARNIIMKF